MLINQALAGSGKTYSDSVKNRIIAAIILITLGLATFAVALFLSDRIPSDFLRGFYTGIGPGLAGGGAVILFRNLFLLKNKEKMKERETAERDERNGLIRMKAASSAFFAGLLAMYACGLTAGFFDQTVMLTLFAACAGLLVIWGIMYLIYSKKY